MAMSILTLEPRAANNPRLAKQPSLQAGLLPSSFFWLGIDTKKPRQSSQACHSDHPRQRPTRYVGRRSEDACAVAPRQTVGILTEALNDVGAEVVATVLAPGVHRRGEMSQRTDLMEAARRSERETAQRRGSVVTDRRDHSEERSDEESRVAGPQMVRKRDSSLPLGRSE